MRTHQLTFTDSHSGSDSQAPMRKVVTIKSKGLTTTPNTFLTMQPHDQHRTKQPSSLSSIKPAKNQSPSSMGKLSFSFPWSKSPDDGHQAAIQQIQDYTAGFERWFYYRVQSRRECKPLHHSADYRI